MKVNELNTMQLSHLAWRLDAKTACGLLTAGRIARLETEFNEKEVAEVFEWAGCTSRSAKIHAKKVADFKLKK